MLLNDIQLSRKGCNHWLLWFIIAGKVLGSGASQKTCH
jgi:hypothetical protein